MKIRASSFAGIAVALVAIAHAASLPPLSGAWNIQSSGSAESSGELLFRVTPANGDDPIEVTVPVLAGASENAVARKIQSTLATQLRADRYNVALGVGANVLVTDQRGQPNFALELLTSDVENLRVAVQSTHPTAAPTVPVQTAPSTPAPQPTPPGPGDNVPPPAGTSPTTPGTNPPPAPPGATPGSPAPGTSPPASPNPAPPPNPTGGAGQPASAPPPG